MAGLVASLGVTLALLVPCTHGILTAPDGDRVYLDITTLANGTSRMECGDTDVDTVKSVSVTEQPLVGACLCDVTLHDASSPLPITIKKKGRRSGSSLALSADVWRQTRTLRLTAERNSLTVASCGFTYQQQAPLTVSIGGNDAHLKCRRTEEDMVWESLCHGPASRDPHATLTLHMALIAASALLIAVILNLISSVIIRRVCDRKPQKDVKGQSHMMRRQPAYRRQQTSQSHPYESIVMDPVVVVSEMDRVGVPTQAAGSRYSAALGGYLPMDGASRDHLLLTDGVETETDLDAFVYPPSTYYEKGISGGQPGADSPGYSHPYGSAENIEWPRKFSVESLDSAAALQKSHHHVKNLARFLESNASFDSGYAERLSAPGDEKQPRTSIVALTANRKAQAVDMRSRVVDALLTPEHSPEDQVPTPQHSPRDQLPPPEHSHWNQVPSPEHSPRDQLQSSEHSCGHGDQDTKAEQSGAEWTSPSAACEEACGEAPPRDEIPGYLEVF